MARRRVRCYGLGRSRDSVGNIKNWHLNRYVNCIHTWMESEHKMIILVCEIYDDNDKGKKEEKDVVEDIF